MRRPAIIATLLLPLPFAALPLISLLLPDGSPRRGDEFALASNTAPIDSSTVISQSDTPLASTTFIDPIALDGCGGPGSPIGG